MYHIIARVIKGVIARLTVLLQRSLYIRPSINIGRFSIIFILVSSVIACGGGGGGGGGANPVNSNEQNTINPNDLDNDGVVDTMDNCLPPHSARNWRANVSGVRDDDGDGCRTGVLPIEDHFDNDPAEYAARVTALRVIPDTTNATLIWNNPIVFEIDQITINYKVSTADSFENTSIIINSHHNLWGGGRDRSYTINGLTTNTNYTFNIALKLGGKDKNYSVSSSRISRIIGPNHDGDRYADADPLENDIDGDGVNNTVDLCDSADSATNWRHGEGRAVDADGDGCRSDRAFPEDVLDNDATEFGDIDNDRVGDIADVDDNNNGLIDIRSADELNQTRNNLAGTSYKKSAGDAGSSRGCGGGGCNGYELMNDIDLAGFDIMSNIDILGFNTTADIDKINLAGYNNWRPIGTCDVTIGGGTIDCRDSDWFNAIFDGNGFTVSNMRIAAGGAQDDPDSYGIGLFGAIGPNAVLRNIHIREGSITNGVESIGLLVGHAMGSDTSIPLIIDSSAQGEVTDSLRSATSLGGLVGAVHKGRVSSSYVLNSLVNAKESIGGLIGSVIESNITSSYVLLSDVNGVGGNIGGLIGFADDTKVSHSYTREGMATTSFTATGSLVGQGLDSLIIHSYSTMTVSHPAAGILFGLGGTNTVTASYWDNETIINGNSDGDDTAKSTGALQTTIDYKGIYSEWGYGWCDPASGNFTTSDQSPLYAHLADKGDIDDFRAWDFGTNMTYPVLTCIRGGEGIQR